MSEKLLQEQANTIRFLASDMVQKANSGHPGAPMGLADIATILSSHINVNPSNPQWLNRDRIVFSGGHASALVYSLLHLWGFDLSLEDLKQFRQLRSKTPGHPEYKHTKGIEITTGPLGQGIANAVGFAMAAKYAQNILDKDIINHKVYCFCGDGDLQEGISYEAISLAGYQKLDNLILIYDSNNITIEGNTNLAWDEDIRKRFESSNFETIEIDGHNFNEINEAFIKAKNSNKPTIIKANTLIAKGSINMVGSHHSHGAPLGEEEIKISKKEASFDPLKSFYISDNIKKLFNKKAIGEENEKQWKIKLKKNDKKNLLEKLLNPDFNNIKYPNFSNIEKIATRDSNHQILNAISEHIEGFIGGSADLAPSNKTQLTNMQDFPNGKNIHFGIREHAMGGIVNAMNLYGLFKVFSATFFVFSDYLKPSVRIAALSNIPHHFIWTHDSIGVGEDGPTHQPIEHLTQFRALPNFYLFRPADANENIKCWEIALKLNSPSAFVCSRQKLDTLKIDLNQIYGDVSNGAYLLKKSINPKITIMASGSEVSLALKTAQELKKENINVNIVSVPCYDLLQEQPKEYIEKIIDKNTIIFALEASTALEYYKYANIVIGMDTFGASGKADELFEYFGFTVEKLKSKILKELSLKV